YTRGRLPCCRPSRTGSHSRGIHSAVSRSLPACFLLLVGCRYPVRSLGCSSLVRLGVGGRRAPPHSGGQLFAGASRSRSVVSRHSRGLLGSQCRVLLRRA